MTQDKFVFIHIGVYDYIYIIYFAKANLIIFKCVTLF